jgi:phosphoribosylglycinamide formyltransferase-1
MNVAFYISGQATRMQKALASGDQELVESTKLIFSDDKQNMFLKDKAAEWGIDYHCLDFSGIPKEEKPRGLVMSDHFLELLRQYDIDYCFSFGGHILRGELLEAFENKIINFHPSILPMFPGIQSVDRAVAARSHLLGSTAHFIDAGVDTGPVVMQNVLSSRTFTPGDYDAVLDHQVLMLRQIFHWLQHDRISVTDNVVTVEGANYYEAVFFPKVELDT